MTLIGIGFGVVGAGGFLGWWMRPTEPGVKRLSELLSAGERQGRTTTGWANKTTAEIAQWRASLMESVVMERVDGRSTIESVMAILSRGVRPDEAVLTAVEQESLLRAVAEDLCARADPDVDRYMKLAEKQGTRWLAPADDDFLWMRIGGAHETLFGVPVDRRAAKEACRAILEKSRELEQSRLTAVGTGEHGLLIRGFMARHETDLARGKFDSDDQMAYWDLWSTPAALVFRVPQPTLQEALSRSGAVKAATVAMVCMSERGRKYPIIAQWFFHKETGRWQIHDITMKGPPVHALIY